MKRTRLILTLLIVITMVSGFMQNGYTLKHHHIEAIFINKSWLNVRLDNSFHNRTTRTFGAHFELYKDIATTTIVVQAFKYSDNTYKKLAPVRYGFDACEGLRKNSFDMQAFTTTNGNLTLCPIKKGWYYVKDFVPPAKLFPPLIPFGTYKAELDVSSDGLKYFAFAWFGSVEKVKKHQK